MDDNSENEKLPFRWALILAISAALGIGIGIAHGLIPGVSLGFVCAGFLHTALPSGKRKR